MRRPATLLCDIGNTSLKLCLADKSGLRKTLVMDHKREHPEKLVEAIKSLSHAQVNRALVASVAPSVDNVLRAALKELLDVEPLFAGRDFVVPMPNRYDNPSQLGVDRLLSAWSARRLLPREEVIIVADFGTAITFDCIVQNEYLGGLIFPGMETAARALALAAEQLPEIDLSAPPEALAIGRNTAQGMRMGLFHGYAALVNGLCAELKKLFPAPARVVATGGFAGNLMDFCPVLDIFYPDLVLRGLWLLGYYPDSEGAEITAAQF